MPAPGWVESCCIIARMSAIAQESNDFTNSDDFGPAVWSSVVQGVGSEGGNPDDPPFVPAGYQDWPNDTTRILVDFTDADDETDTIDLLPNLRVLDLDIAGSSNTVSTPTSPAPIMVGQQVQLQAVTPNGQPVSGTVQWTFDSTSVKNVVGNAYTQNISVVGTPSPVQTSGNPITFYWVSAGTKHVHASAVVNSSRLTGDVYYPVTAPSPTITNATAPVQVSTDTVGSSLQCAPPFSTFMALHVGIPCSATTPTPSPGILMQYSVAVPSYGVGQIAVAQLVKETYSAVNWNGSPVQSFTTGASPVLDTQFPFYGVMYSTGMTATIPDSPWLELTGLGCKSVDLQEYFTDYFMYQPTPQGTPSSSGPSRPSIWVTTATQKWNWGGTAIQSANGTWSKKSALNPGTVTATSATTLPSWNANITGFTLPPCVGSP